MIIYKKTLKTSQKIAGMLEPINKFSKVAEHKIDIKKISHVFKYKQQAIRKGN